VWECRGGLARNLLLRALPRAAGQQGLLAWALMVLTCVLAWLGIITAPYVPLLQRCGIHTFFLLGYFRLR
jgi:uncharacterized membrane protein YccC